MLVNYNRPGGTLKMKVFVVFIVEGTSMLNKSCISGIVCLQRKCPIQSQQCINRLGTGAAVYPNYKVYMYVKTNRSRCQKGWRKLEIITAMLFSYNLYKHTLIRGMSFTSRDISICKQILKLRQRQFLAFQHTILNRIHDIYSHFIHVTRKMAHLHNMG